MGWIGSLGQIALAVAGRVGSSLRVPVTPSVFDQRQKSRQGLGVKPPDQHREMLTDIIAVCYLYNLPFYWRVVRWGQVHAK